MTDDYDSPEAEARREAYYNKECWCGHALGNHSQITGDCMLCDHSTTADQIREHEARMARARLSR
jgi:hypothetical protein